MNSIYKDLSGQGRGRGRGRGRQVTNGGTSSITPWSTRTSNDNINRDHSQSGKASNSSNKKSFNKSATEEHWKKRETASDSRLEKAKKIRQTAAENFSHLLDESDSSDEELKEEEILKNAVKSYKEQFEGLKFNAVFAIAILLTLKCLTIYYLVICLRHCYICTYLNGDIIKCTPGLPCPMKAKLGSF